MIIDMKKNVTLLLLGLLVCAALLRLASLTYGLPLWLINDEPSTILGALKMMELKSLIPAFHQSEMTSILYYPPYISYLYLIPFSIIFLFQYFYYGVSFEMLTSIVTQDLSPYFIAARLMSIAAGLIGIFLLYKTSLNLFSSKKAALFSIFFAATSLVSIALSVSARHWIFISLVYSLAMYILSKKETAPSRKYFLFYITAALGIGVSTISVFLFVIPPFWYILQEKNSYRDLWNLRKEMRFYGAVTIIGFLSLLPSFLYPQSNGFIVDVTTGSSKSILEAVISPYHFLERIFVAEPILIILFVIGFVFLFKNYRKLFWILGGFIYLYSTIFYFMFRFESRFVLPLSVFIFLSAGYGTERLWNKNVWVKIILIILLLIPTTASLKLAQLGWKNDSRVQTVEWAYRNLSEQDRVITFGSQLRLPVTHETLAELKKLDPLALRRVDLSEERLSSDALRRFNSLNVYTLQNDNVIEDLKNYSRKNKYTYLIREHADSELGGYVRNIVRDNDIQLQSFGYNAPYSLATSEFTSNPFKFFTVKALGPEITIYKLLP